MSRLTDFVKLCVLSAITDKHLCQSVTLIQVEYPEKVHEDSNSVSSNYCAEHVSHKIVIIIIIFGRGLEYETYR